MKELNTGLAKTGFQELIYKVVIPAIFFLHIQAKEILITLRMHYGFNCV